MKIFTRLEIIASVILFVVLINITPIVGVWWRDSYPISDWFVAEKIYVSDTSEGTEPVITYDREIKQPFTATYTVKVVRVDRPGRFAVCDNSETIDYRPQSGPVNITLKQFLGEECHLEPGVYVLEVTWIIMRPGYSDYSVREVSNPFRVEKK